MHVSVIIVISSHGRAIGPHVTTTFSPFMVHCIAVAGASGTSSILCSAHGLCAVAWRTSGGLLVQVRVSVRVYGLLAIDGHAFYTWGICVSSLSVYLDALPTDGGGGEGRTLCGSWAPHQWQTNHRISCQYNLQAVRPVFCAATTICSRPLQAVMGTSCKKSSLTKLFFQLIFLVKL